MITNAWSPNSLSVSLFPVFKTKPRVIYINAVKCVTAKVPIYKVF